MKFLVLLALVASARAFSYTTGTAHPAGYAYRSHLGYTGYAGHYTGYNPYTTHAYRNYLGHPLNLGYTHTVAHAPLNTKVVTHEVATPVLKSVVAPAVAVASPTYYTHASYAPSTSQYRQQNEIGEYQFGYKGDTSSRDEIRTADGIVQGSYSYIDANNIPQKVDYVADALGFRVAGTNVPASPVPAATVVEHVAPAAAVVEHTAVEHPTVHHTTVLKSALVDQVNPHVPYTPEVAAARANHLAALNTAAYATHATHATHVIAKRSADPAGGYSRYGGRSYSRGHGGYRSYGGARRSYGNSYGRRGSYRRY